MPEETRPQLRSRLRRRRRELSPAQQAKASIALDRQLTASRWLTRHRDIAFYLANDGEISPDLLLRRAYLWGKRCYLPVLAADNRLWFVRYYPGEALKKNRFGIPEPVQRRQRRAPWTLGLVLMPLVGFDRTGARLGMGGGFYDRSFSYLNRLPAMRRPRLVGLAHSCQEVSALKVESWDIPLDWIVTEREMIRTEGQQ